MNWQSNQVCELAGHKLAYQRLGQGEPVLLVHGITTYSFIWRRIIPQLSWEYDVIAVDLLGCGNSDKPLDVPYSLRQHAEILLEFTRHLGLERFHFIGHDVGGGVGQIFAVRYGQHLYDLTVINTVAYDYWPVQPISAIRTPIIRQLVMAVLDRGALKQIVLRGVYHDERVDSELMDLFWMPMRSREGRKAFLHFAKSLDNQDLMVIAENLKLLSLPVLIIRGEADLYLSAAISDRLHREIPNSRLVKIPTAGHFIQEDEPELLVDFIMQFFEEAKHDRQ
jgi:pimeloyl-ACP methyl ester carboxylesterase